MVEAEIRSPRRLSWKRIILVAFLLGLFVLTVECYLTYLRLAEPNYLELELPAEVLHTTWASEDHIVYVEPDNGFRFFIWQKIGVFDGASSTDVADELDEWLTGHGWRSSSDTLGFGYRAKFHPCQPSNKDVTEIQCRYYASTTEYSAFLCSDFIAALYAEYIPDLEQGQVVITTIRMSSLQLMMCGLNYL